MTAEIIPIRPAPTVADFDRFWAAFPKKHKIGPARSQWMWALAKTGNDPEPIISGAIRYAEYCRRKGTEETYIAPPHQWLADERWHDVYEQASTEIDPVLERLTRLAQMVKRQHEGAFYRDYVRKNVTESDMDELRKRGLI